MSKKIITSLFIILLLSGFVFVQFLNAQNTTPTVTVVRGDIQKTVKASGNLQSGGVVNLYANTTGIITKLYVQNNQPVVRGQKIAEIKSTATETEIATARASYQAALNNLKTSQSSKPTLQSQLEAARKTVIDAANAENKLDERLGASQPNPSTGRSYTQEEIDSIRSATVSARQSFTAAEQKYRDVDASITATQGALALAQLNFNATKDATLKANADGTILNLAVQEGDLVRAGADGMQIPVSPLGIIADLSKYAIKVAINETRIGEISEGQTANIIFDSQKQTTYTGTVRTKDTIGTNANGLISYNVYITPTSYLPDTIKPGMTAEVEIITEQSLNTLLIPQTAVTQQNGMSYVTIINAEKNTQETIEVETGLMQSGQVEILRGLSEGDSLVVMSDEK